MCRPEQKRTPSISHSGSIDPFGRSATNVSTVRASRAATLAISPAQTSNRRISTRRAIPHSRSIDCKHMKLATTPLSAMTVVKFWSFPNRSGFLLSTEVLCPAHFLRAQTGNTVLKKRRKFNPFASTTSQHTQRLSLFASKALPLVCDRQYPQRRNWASGVWDPPISLSNEVE